MPKAHSTSYHSKACCVVGSYDDLDELDEVQQDYVLNCPHPDHDGIRKIHGLKFDYNTRQLVELDA